MQEMLHKWKLSVKGQSIELEPLKIPLCSISLWLNISRSKVPHRSKGNIAKVREWKKIQKNGLPFPTSKGKEYI